MKDYKFILSGGGTGGHIYPAIAIADELKHRFPNAEFLFVGAKDRMEMQKVPQAGYKIKGLWIAGIQRKLTLENLSFPLKLADSLLKSRKIIREFQPDIAIGTGGFASGPLLKVANAKGIPTVLQEQNSYAGITNKWLAGKASKICVAYKNMDRYFPKEKIIFTGNPVRKDLLSLVEKRRRSQEFFDLNPRKKTLLVLGGSLGARRINELIAEETGFFEKNDLQVIWQCGKLYYSEYKHLENSPLLQVHPFIERMDLAFSGADFIISRAGAIAVSELCLVGKPVIFIPSPNVAEDHQTKNAMALRNRNAALVLREHELSAKFEVTFQHLADSDEEQKTLSENIKKMGKPEATSAIADVVQKLILEVK